MTPTVPPSPAQGETAGVSERPSAPCRSCGNVHLIGAVHDFMGSPKMCIHDHNLIVAKLRQQLAAREAECRVKERALTSLSQQLAEMRGAVDRDYKDLLAVLYALRDLPTIPDPRVLSMLSKAGKFPDDWETGKRMQNEHGLDAIPPNTECEIGAGFWNRLSAALAPTSQPSRGKCETCSGSGRLFESTVVPEDTEIPCPDCAQPERQGADSRECGQCGGMGGDSERVCPGCGGCGLAKLERPSPPPTAGPDGPSDIVAGLREILAGKNVAIDPSIINRAIAALEGAK